MKINKGMWYFRSTVKGGDDDDLASILIPVDKLTGFTPGDNSASGSNTTLTIHYKNNGLNSINTHDGVPTQNGYITLTVESKKQFEVMSVLADAAVNNDSVPRVIWDEHTKETIHSYIKGVSLIKNI
tara:strand:- start:51 stop:431 length:381 start_codon:yes stop_codon:yes gene_type:complete